MIPNQTHSPSIYRPHGPQSPQSPSVIHPQQQQQPQFHPFVANAFYAQLALQGLSPQSISVLNTTHSMQHVDQSRPQQQRNQYQNAQSISSPTTSPCRPATTTQAQGSPASVSSDEIYKKNNIRLQQLEADLNKFSSFGFACDELGEWVKDARAYNAANQDMLLRCAKVLAKNGCDYGPYSAITILDTMCTFKRYLPDPTVQAQIQELRDQFHMRVFNAPQRTQSPIFPGHSQQHQQKEQLSSPVQMNPTPPLSASSGIGSPSHVALHSPTASLPPIYSQAPSIAVPSYSPQLPSQTYRPNITGSINFSSGQVQQHQQHQQRQQHQQHQQHHQHQQNQLHQLQRHHQQLHQQLPHTPQNMSPSRPPHQSFQAVSQPQTPASAADAQRIVQRVILQATGQLSTTGSSSGQANFQSTSSYIAPPPMVSPSPSQNVAPTSQPSLVQPHITPQRAPSQPQQRRQHIQRQQQPPEQLPQTPQRQQPQQQQEESRPPVSQAVTASVAALPTSVSLSSPLTVQANRHLCLPARPSPPPHMLQAPSANSDFKFLRRVNKLQEFSIDPAKPVVSRQFFLSSTMFKRIWFGRPLSTREFPLSIQMNSYHPKKTVRCEWPEDVEFTVNGKVPKMERRRKVPAKDGQGLMIIGKDKPLDMRSLLQEGSNTIDFVLNRNVAVRTPASEYIIVVDMFIRETEDTIKMGVHQRAPISVEEGRLCVNTLLGKATPNKDDDVVISQDSVRISLKCPISLQRITYPVRGKQCKHPDCFELSSYLAVNVENTSWKCPHCHGYTPPHQLARDFFFERLIQEAGKQAVEIEFRGDCDQWRVTRSETPDDGDDFDEDDEPDKKRLPASTEEPANVISLISDDEDDEPPQLPSGPSTTTTNMTTSHTATTTTTTTITTMPSAGQRRDGRSLSADLSPGTPADNSTSHSNKRSRLNFEFGDLNLEPDADFHRVLMGIDSNSH